MSEAHLYQDRQREFGVRNGVGPLAEVFRQQLKCQAHAVLLGTRKDRVRNHLTLTRFYQEPEVLRQQLKCQADAVLLIQEKTRLRSALNLTRFDQKSVVLQRLQIQFGIM